MLNFINKRDNIIIFFCAVIICANPINWILKIDNGLAIITLVLFSFIVILGRQQIIHNVNPKIFFLIFYILFFFVISLLQTNFHPQTVSYLLQFAILGILPLLISQIYLQYDRIYVIILFLGILFIPFAFNFNIENYYSQFESDIWGFIMGVSYGLLRFIVAGFIVLLLYTPKNLFLKIIILLETIAIISFLALYGTRGAILSSLLLLILLLLLRKHTYLNRKALITFFSILLTSIILWMLFSSYVYPIIQNKGVSFIFIDKILSLKEEGDVSNGRIEIAQYTLKHIVKKPFIGHGIGSFDNYSGAYPHNLFLHFLYEGGVFLCIPFIGLISKSIYIMLSKQYEFNYRIYVIFLFFSSVIELLFSSQPWISQIFWLYIGSVLIAGQFKLRTEYIC
jgi:O-antigen ligase